MQLTAEFFQELSQFLRVPDKNRTFDKDRRRGMRTSFNGYAGIICCDDPAEMKKVERVTVIDVSAYGISITRSNPIYADQRFILCLDSDHGQPRSILCTVARWQPIDVSTFFIAANFTQQLNVGIADALNGEALYELHLLEEQLRAV